MSNVHEICEAVGRRRLATDLGVGKTAVSNAVVEGRFPAKWYVIVKAHCDAIGIECPTSAFSFAEPPTGVLTASEAAE